MYSIIIIIVLYVVVFVFYNACRFVYLLLSDIAEFSFSSFLIQDQVFFIFNCVCVDLMEIDCLVFRVIYFYFSVILCLHLIII